MGGLILCDVHVQATLTPDACVACCSEAPIEGFKAHDVEYRLLLFDVIDLIGFCRGLRKRKTPGRNIICPGQLVCTPPAATTTTTAERSDSKTF
jgi:hypothetical protein